jgi:hypothetical protein
MPCLVPTLIRAAPSTRAIKHEESCVVSKNLLQEPVVSDAAYVDQAERWARFLTQVETRGPGDIENAWSRLERKYGVPSRTFWSLRYRKPKQMLVSIYMGLRAAYEAECQRQFRRYQHEIAIAHQIGAVADPLAAEAAALVDDKKTPEEL